MRLGDEGRRDLSRFARGIVIVVAGAIGNGLFGFLLILVITRGLHAVGAGIFFEGLAIFQIASNVAELGADDGLVRMIPTYRATGRTGELRRTLAVGIAPVVVLATALAVIVFVFARPLADLFTNGVHPAPFAQFLQVLAPFLPLSAVSTVCLSATRGLGTMVPMVIVDNFGKPGIRPVLVLLVLALGMGSVAVAAAWAAPIVAGLVVAVVALLRLLRDAERADPPSPGAARSRGALANEFWRFAAPRGIAALFSILLFWIDTLLVGALDSTHDAGIYAAVTRFLAIGLFPLAVAIDVISPQIAGLFARGRHDRAETMFKAATGWMMAPSWPILITLATFAPVILKVYGRGFEAGQAAVTILSVTALVNMMAGPVSAILLMGGRSVLNLVNTAVGLAVNIGLNLILIPEFGIIGAAVAWAVTTVTYNVAALIEVRVLFGVRPVGPSLGIVAVAGACFAAVAASARAVLGASIPAVALTLGVGTVVYVAILWRYRTELQFPILWEAARSRARGEGGPAAAAPGVVPDHSI